MKKAVTIKEIAEQLNLSRNTVAKALNGHYVPESTREAVLKKAMELGYKSLGNNGEEGREHYRFILISGKPLNTVIPRRSPERFPPCLPRLLILFDL